MRSLHTITLPSRLGTDPKPTLTSDMQRMKFTQHTRVIEEIVLLAAKHVGVKAVYIMPKDGTQKGEIRVANVEESKLFEYIREFNRLEDLITKPLDEPLMDDNDPVHQGLMYVVDGKTRMFIDGMNMTVGRWKRLPGDLAVSSVRRCDLVGRQLRLPEKKETPTSTTSHRPHHWDPSGRTIVQAKRRSRTSNKIKKISQ